ncbi:MAG: anhydro-N-acetylmuramic acid kinase [Cytophaga sp.]|uniref:anhydro-N-acetylmuramic acid kinase n=1 Tax=Cytophaga sp. TaxID=29535 RepID=UPI003F80D49A
MKHKTYTVAGLMSGTSLDGLDIAVCRFEQQHGRWTYKTLAAETIDYSEDFKVKLNQAMRLTGEELIALDRQFGTFQGNEVAAFLKRKNLSADLVAAHGHTIFHNPSKGYTLQIGSGASLYAACHLPVVTDLRSVDVAFGGQGAPLVPLGDELLFSEYAGCLNLGGIANVSFLNHENNIAYDICAINIVLNALALKSGKSYDDGGSIARNGKLIPELLEQLEKLPYYKLPFPKSLGREWVDEVVFPLIKTFDKHEIKDLLHTYVIHCAKQIGAALSAIPAKKNQSKVLITGGGAFNTFFLEQLRQYTGPAFNPVVPDKETVQYKEAIIFGFLGLLRMLNLPNAKSTVTGASKDSIGGAIYGSISGFYVE